MMVLPYPFPFYLTIWGPWIMTTFLLPLYFAFEIQAILRVYAVAVNQTGFAFEACRRF